MAKKKAAKKSAAKKTIKKTVSKAARKKASKPTMVNKSIPAICDNPKCGTVWICPMLPAIADGIATKFIGCHVSPCPACGSRGTIPDGEYTGVSGDMFRKDQFDKLISAIRELQDRVLHGAGDAEVTKQVDSKNT